MKTITNIIGSISANLRPIEKSAPCSKVLQLMDMNYSYQQALKVVLDENPHLNKGTLELELEFYI